MLEAESRHNNENDKFRHFIVVLCSRKTIHLNTSNLSLRAKLKQIKSVSILTTRLLTLRHVELFLGSVFPGMAIQLGGLAT